MVRQKTYQNSYFWANYKEQYNNFILLNNKSRAAQVNQAVHNQIYGLNRLLTKPSFRYFLKEWKTIAICNVAAVQVSYFFKFKLQYWSTKMSEIPFRAMMSFANKETHDLRN